MEIHRSSLNFSTSRLSLRTSGKLDAVTKQPKQEFPPPEQHQQISDAVSETPVDVEKILANKGLAQLSNALEKTTQTLDIRKLNAINAYTSQRNLPMLEQRAQLLVGIDLYV